MKTDRSGTLFTAAGDRISSALSRFTIRSILFGSFAAVISIGLAMVLLVQWGEKYAFQSMNKFVNVDNVISDLCLKSNTAMTEARRNEKDFLLNYREFGFNEAKSRYITRVLTSLADVKEYMNSVRLMANDPEVTRQTIEVDHAVDLYQAGVLSLADKYEARGYADTGLEGTMRAAALEIEGMIRRQKNDLLLADLLALRTKEKDFLERSNDTDVLMFQEAMERFKTDISASGLSSGLKETIKKKADAFNSLFIKYVQATEDIRQVKKSYLHSIQTVDPMLEKLYVHSLERVKAARNKMGTIIRIFDLPVLVAGLCILMFSTFVALFISGTVSNSVVECKTFAEQIASGNLRQRLTPKGNNEFFALSNSLNKMAESLYNADIAQRSWTARLRESEQRFRSIFENANDGILLADPENKKFVDGNKMICQMLGYNPEEIKGLAVTDIHPEEELPYALETFERQAREETAMAVDLPVKRKDGSVFYADINAFQITLSGKIYLIGFFRDVTNRKQAEEELRKHREQLEELVAKRTEEALKAAHLASIGELAAGVAHEINNPINGIINYAELLGRRLVEGSREKDISERIIKEGERVAVIVKGLLSFARERTEAKSPVRVADILSETLVMTGAHFRKDGITLSEDIPEALPEINASFQQIQQVFLNILNNARYALNQKYPPGHKDKILKITAERITAGDEARVRVIFLDNGIGIPSEIRDKILNPFFTTKPVNAGTGLGLSISHGIVKDHGGDITVESRVGEFTKIAIDFPVMQGNG